MTGPRDIARTGGRGRLPTPLRDRRPALAALALLLVVAGALGSALVAYRSGHRVDILTVRADIAPGHKMVRSDFGTTRVASDDAAVVPVASENNIVGAYATTRIPSGTLINAHMFVLGQTMPPDSVIVGVTLTANQRPADTLVEGDVVRAIFVPKASSQGSDTAGTVLVNAARIASVSSGAANSVAASDSLTVSLLVSSADALALVPAAAGGQVALVLLADSTAPAVDFRS